MYFVCMSNGYCLTRINKHQLNYSYTLIEELKVKILEKIILLSTTKFLKANNNLTCFPPFYITFPD